MADANRIFYLGEHGRELSEIAYDFDSAPHAALAGSIFGYHQRDISGYPAWDCSRQHWTFRDELERRVVTFVLAMQVATLEALEA